MRSLGMAPTIYELKGYYNTHKKEGKNKRMRGNRG